MKCDYQKLCSLRGLCCLVIILVTVMFPPRYSSGEEEGPVVNNPYEGLGLEWCPGHESDTPTGYIGRPWKPTPRPVEEDPSDEEESSDEEEPEIVTGCACWPAEQECIPSRCETKEKEFVLTTCHPVDEGPNAGDCEEYTREIRHRGGYRCPNCEYRERFNEACETTKACMEKDWSLGPNGLRAEVFLHCPKRKTGEPIRIECHRDLGQDGILYVPEYNPDTGEGCCIDNDCFGSCVGVLTAVAEDNCNPPPEDMNTDLGGGNSMCVPITGGGGEPGDGGEGSGDPQGEGGGPGPVT